MGRSLRQPTVRDCCRPWQAYSKTLYSEGATPSPSRPPRPPMPPCEEKMKPPELAEALLVAERMLPKECNR